MRIAILAGEASGDILGAGLIQALKSRFPHAQFEGVGGPLMIEQGLASEFPMERLSVMGLVEVLGRLPELLKRRRKLVDKWTRQKPDLFIGIDAPDFNIGLEGKLRQAGIPTVHYVSPSVWAWRRKRVFKIQKTTDLMLTLLPFEAQFYREHQVRVEFVGHPLANMIAVDNDKLEAREQLKQKHQLVFDNAHKVLALLPGSRGGEVGQLARPFLQTAQHLLEKHPGLQFVMPAANEKRFAEIKALIDAEFSALPLQLIQGDSRTVMAASDAILIASGTATLEAMLVGRPMVVAYRMAPMTYRILSRLIKSRYISLPNLLADEALVPEILQDEVRHDVLSPLLEKALFNEGYAEDLQERFRELHLVLKQNANERAATAIEQLLRDKGAM